MEKPTLFIENWGTARDDSDIYKAPEVRPFKLVGNIIEDVDLPKHKVRPKQKTSHIIGYEIDKGQIETRNTIYRLGYPAPEYIERINPDSYIYKEMAKVGLIPDDRGWYFCEPPRLIPFIAHGKWAGEISGIDHKELHTNFVQYNPSHSDYAGFRYTCIEGDGYAAWMQPICWRHMFPEPDLTKVR